MPCTHYYGFNIVFRRETQSTPDYQKSRSQELGWKRQAICGTSQLGPPKLIHRRDPTCFPLPNLSLKKEEAEATRKEALKYKLMG